MTKNKGQKEKKFNQEIYVLAFNHFSCGAIASGGHSVPTPPVTFYIPSLL
ncbi:MAG: hypothetical protein V7L20_00885 [Nostoc sp.]